MSSVIDEIEVTVFDTETTGLDYGTGDRIVELAAVKLKGAVRIGEFNSLIDPGRPISTGAFNVNKITPDMLAFAPKPEEVLPQFIDFAKGSILVSYNIDFDLGFLNNELRILGMKEIDNIPVLDLLKVARIILPGLKSYALFSVADRLGIQEKQEHRALSDVKITLDVFYRFKEIMREKGFKDFSSFLELPNNAIRSS